MRLLHTAVFTLVTILCSPMAHAAGYIFWPKPVGGFGGYPSDDAYEHPRPGEPSFGGNSSTLTKLRVVYGSGFEGQWDEVSKGYSTAKDRGLLRSTRSFYDDSDVGARARELGYYEGTNDGCYSKDCGRLNPGDRIVLSPVMYFLEWRKGKSQAGYAPDYDRGNFGADAVNALPEWAQAFLRLTHTMKTDAFPISPKIETQVREIDLDQLRGDYIAKQARAAELRAKFGSEQAIRDAEAAIPRATFKVNSDQSVVDELSAAIVSQTSDIRRRARELRTRYDLSNHFFALLGCRIVHGYYNTCLESDRQRTIDEPLAEARKALEQLRWRLRDAESELIDHKDLLSEKLAKSQVQRLSQSDFAALKNDLASAEKTATQAGNVLAHVTGFVSQTSSPFKRCARPFVYHGDPSLTGTHLPFFGEVEAELIPDGSANLWACTDDSGNVRSFAIVQTNGVVVASSNLDWADDEVVRLEILDADGKVVETQSWTKEGDSTLYDVSFKRPSGDSFGYSRDAMVEIHTTLGSKSLVELKRR